MSRLIPDLQKLEYTERLKKLNLPSLYYRRARGDMIECYKYLTGMYNVAGNLLPQDELSNTRGHSLKLKKPCVKTSARENFFSVRIVNAWNSLPDAVVTATSLNSFKTRLDRVWADYTFTLSSEWFKSPPRDMRTRYKTCEKIKHESASSDSERPIGD